MEEYVVRRTKNETNETSPPLQNGGTGAANNLYSQKIAQKKNNPPIDQSGIDGNVTELYPEKTKINKQSKVESSKPQQKTGGGSGLSNVLLFLLLLSNLGMLAMQANLFNKVGDNYQETNSSLNSIQNQIDESLPSINKALGELKGEFSNNLQIASRKIGSLSRELKNLKIKKGFDGSNNGGGTSSNNVIPASNLNDRDESQTSKNLAHSNKNKDSLGLESRSPKSGELPINNTGVFMDEDKKREYSLSDQSQTIRTSKSSKKLASNKKHYPVRCWKKRKILKRCFLSKF